MDFLEQLFHLWPDGGDGFTELAIVVSLGLGLVLWQHTRQHRGGIFNLKSQPASEPLQSFPTDGESDANNY